MAIKNFLGGKVRVTPSVGNATGFQASCVSFTPPTVIRDTYNMPQTETHYTIPMGFQPVGPAVLVMKSVFPTFTGHQGDTMDITVVQIAEEPHKPTKVSTVTHFMKASITQVDYGTIEVGGNEPKNITVNFGAVTAYKRTNGTTVEIDIDTDNDTVKISGTRVFADF